MEERDYNNRNRENNRLATDFSGSSSGGCNAGYGAFALMFAIPLIFKKRK